MNDRLSRPRPALVVGVAAIGLLVGLASERSATGFKDVGAWVPDLAVGWTFVGCGLAAWRRKPSSGVGLLMVATGGAWFLPNFAFASTPALVWLAERTTYLYRGPLIHVLLTFPTGRTTSRALGLFVVLGYVAALVTPVWQSDAASIVLAILLVAVGLVEYRRSLGAARRARLVTLRFDILAALVLAATSIVRMAVPSGRAIDASRLAFELSLCALAVAMLVALLLAPWERAAVTDLVVEMRGARSEDLREQLARALGDPSLEVGYRLPGADSYVDARGSPLVVPEPGSERAVTMVGGGDDPVAVLVHDPAVLDDPGLVEAVSAAARLAASNARLQAEVSARMLELVASRRRLLEAGDEERRRLERRLHDGAEDRLERMATTLERARAQQIGPKTRGALEAAQAELRWTLDDLVRLGRGLHPRELTELGLGGALRALAASAPLPVSVSVDLTGSAPAAEAAAYYLCAEALANVAKHARATSAAISVASSEGLLTVDVTDDGVGGADGAEGSGLRGLVDRIETLGGSLSIDSPLGWGTHLVARIPLNPTGTA